MRSWQSDLEVLLLKRGTAGLTQSDITIAFHKRATAEELETYLTALQSERKVQRFQLPRGPRGGRHATVWRATTLLAEKT